MALNPQQFRSQCRAGLHTGPSAGVADNFVQANLMIVPQDWAYDFLLFCERNPKPCPLVEVLDAGAFEPVCASAADLRSDLPGYRVWRDGVLVQEVSDISHLWRADLVSFLIGCSFSFETALQDEGIRLRHIDEHKNVAMYKTNRACAAAGRLHGPLVVSMRPIKSQDVARAVEISARFPDVHGAPVHVGDPKGLGIADLSCPDYGDAVQIMDHELPVFWACGVTPQSVAVASGIPFCITHAPGKMFVTDRPIRAATF
jgi:uncharacterized protein YcsI (UPF0317 family)